MRCLLASTLILATTLDIGTARQGAEQASPRFDPPTVTAVVDVAYPLQSVASGTVALEVSLDDAGRITDGSCCARDTLTKRTCRASRATVEVSASKTRWKARRFKGPYSFFLPSTERWTSCLSPRTKSVSCRQWNRH